MIAVGSRPSASNGRCGALPLMRMVGVTAADTTFRLENFDELPSLPRRFPTKIEERTSTVNP